MLNDALSAHSVALLDVNSTFMFGEDRFGPEQDYAATYGALGGGEMSSEGIRSVVDSVIAHLKPIYIDPDRCDSFPSVSQVLAQLPASRDLPMSERSMLEQVVASHEVGHIPDAYAEGLRILARTHRLGIVSNIWSVKHLWVEEMRRACVLDLFGAVVFSSDGASMKPSPALFELALREIGAGPSETVFIGDSLRCDVAGAAAVGIATVWIDRHGSGLQADAPQPMWTVRDLLQLIQPDVSGVAHPPNAPSPTP